MLNKLSGFIRRYGLIQPGDRVFCAVSGGADSVALLFGMYLLRERLQIQLSAVHFNHQLRGAESDEDQEFVRRLCDRLDIPLHIGTAAVRSGQKGLEAAAREARYAYFDSLPGKIATAHTADDNAETVLLHLIRGTGLKGLGAIAPVRGRIIRPMLSVTREDVLEFLRQYCLSYREDSSNGSDQFLRNRIRHHVMPLLREENPRIGENLSQMALRLREDEQFLCAMAQVEGPLSVEALKTMPPAQRSRVLDRFLKDNHVPEPEAEHIALAEAVVFSNKPSARVQMPGGITLRRCYDTLICDREVSDPEEITLECPGFARIPELGLQVVCTPARELRNEGSVFTVDAKGSLCIRFRRSGDTIRLKGGSRSLKKLFIDRKIPAHIRDRIPVICDEEGILGVWGIGADQNRLAPVWQIQFIKDTES